MSPRKLHVTSLRCVCVYLCAHHHHRNPQIVCERAVSQGQQHALLVLAPPLRSAVLAAAWLCVLLELFDNCAKTKIDKHSKSGASKDKNHLLVFPASVTYAGAPSLAAFRAAPGVCRCVPERRRPTSGESPGRSTAATCRPLSTATCR